MALTQVSTDGIKNGTITGSDLATNVDLIDNQKLRLGTGNDLQIYHDGSNSYLEDTGTGKLILLSSQVQINNPASNETMANFIQNGAVELYYNDSKKFETDANGAEVLGNRLRLSDNVKLACGAGADLEIYHSSNNNYIDAATGFTTFIRAGTDNAIAIVPNGTVELYFDNVKKFQTISSGIEITSVLGIANVGGTLAGSGGTENWLGIKDSAGNFQFAVKTHGTNNGSVGIGTTSPQAVLHVEGGSSGNLIQLSNTHTGATNTDGFVFGINSSLTYLYNRENKDIAFGTNNTERLRITSSGDLGIGTTSPDRTIHCHKSSNTTNVRVKFSNSTTGECASDGFEIGINASDPAQAVLVNNENSPMAFFTNASERMRITSDGKVGVGTTAPEAKFSVNDQTNPDIALMYQGTTGGHKSRYLFIDKRGFINAQVANNLHDDGVGTAAASLMFATSHNGTLSTAMAIERYGKVGINTTAPDAKLEIVDGSNPDIRLKYTGTASGHETRLMFIDKRGAINAQVANILHDDGVGTAAASLMFATSTGGTLTERMRIDSSGVVRVGGTDSYNSSDKLTLVGTGNTSLTIDATSSTESSVFFADGATGTEAYRGFLQYKHSVDALTIGPSATERMRITSGGGVNVGSGVLTSNTNDGNILVDEGIYIGTFNGDNQIRSSSAGGGSATLFIGNQSIQTSSDRRIKQNIVDTEIDALSKLEKVKVVDFNWNDPSDKAINNKNARGKWTGCIAQEIVDIFPHAVNAPRPEGKEIDYTSENLWTIQYEHLVPVLIKAIQELTAKVEALEAK